MACNLTTSPLPSLLHSYVPQSLRPFVTLSYPITDPLAHPSAQTLYDKGPQDACLVLFWALAFTLLREAFMKGVFSPFMRICLPSPPQVKGQEREYAKARKKREHTVTRFAEQGWSWLYCSIYWTFGVIVLRQNPSPTSPEQLWGTYPAVPLPALTKFYYLSQLGWWFHQLLVINCEKRRKDHWQMFGHHILTITLVVGSYVMNFTSVGVVIHCLMDFCDILLPLAKMFRYLSLSTLCDLTFVVFLISWFITREAGLFLVIRSTYVDAPKFIPFEWAPEQGRFLTYRVYLGFVAMLSILWILATAWFYMACNVAIRVVRGMGAEDSRSDDESEEDALEQVPESVGTSTATRSEVEEDLRKRKLFSQRGT
ncbi:acyl-CoA-dependent ceramide synthase [Cryptococcus neoformans Ze90-1]|nr:acyl-CoA-dependent ceramide synthase [Cryptococcus neoformans var. grubii Ze90-1]